MAPEADRKLAAILSADVVGYSRLMAEDEAATIRTLTDYREAISMLVRQHRGRVVDSPGDNLLAEFPTALDAVQAAVEIQRVIGARNADLPAERRMEFRIGVHMGDISVEGERVYGEGVNISARLEGLAAPGGVCISGTVQEQVRHKLERGYEDLGEQSVKNISEPIRAYQVRPEAPVPTPMVEPKTRPRALLVAGVVVLLVVAGLLAWRLPTTTPSIAPSDEQFTVPGFGDAPAIAVLAFDNMSGDPEQEYFANGIAEDLITRLSALRSFPVIARNSSFVYGGEAVDVKRVSRELGVRYVLEGSVRKTGDRVRISAQLIDASTGVHVWAETYDRQLHDILTVQDEITQSIAQSVSPELLIAEAERAARKDPRNLNAYDLTMRGFWHLAKFTKEHNAQARALFRKAAALEPDQVRAFIGISHTHYLDLLHQWTDSVPASQIALRSAAERCLELDERSPSCHMALGGAYRWAGQRDPMIASYQRSVEISPSYAVGLTNLGIALALAGRSEEAIANIRRSMRLSPKDPRLGGANVIAMALAHFGAERYEEAIDWAERALQHRGSTTFGWRVLAVSYAHLGKSDEAHSAAAEVLRSYPEFSVSHVAMEFAAAEPAFLEQFLDGLRKAGLPEE